LNLKSVIGCILVWVLGPAWVCFAISLTGVENIFLQTLNYLLLAFIFCLWIYFLFRLDRRMVFRWKTGLSIVVTAIGYTVAYTVIFLAFRADPMAEALGWFLAVPEAFMFVVLKLFLERCSDALPPEDL